MDTPRKEEDTVPPFLPAEDFSTGVFDMGQLDDHLLGTVVAGRYTVTRLLGTGGMGRVYEAFDAAEQREVALKVLHADRIGSTQAVQRFMEEARVLSMLSHPNVVRLYDFGQDDSGVVFLVMEMLVGRDLGDHLAERRRLPWSEASEIALQLCRGLSAAHDRGIVHRDLKPENVFLQHVPPGAAPRIKLLDFGIAKDVQSHNAKLTGEGSVFGTARYMSPEQASGSPVDARSDVYGVGILVYEMITGRPPFVGDDFLRTAHQHVTDPYPPLSEVAPDVPFHPLVEEMIERALAKRREDRFATMFDFEAAIEGTTIESTMAIIRPRLPPERPPPERPSEDRTVIRAPPVDDRAAARSVPNDRITAIAAPDFDDDYAATVIRPTTGEVLMQAPEDRTVMRATLVPPPAMPPPAMPPPAMPVSREERTVIRAAPVAEEPRPARRQAPPQHDERTVIRQSPLGVAGTIVPLTQPPYPMPSGPPPSYPMPGPMPYPTPGPMPYPPPNDGDTVAMQIPIMDPYGPAPIPQAYQPPTSLAAPVVRMPMPTPAPVPRPGPGQFGPGYSGGQLGQSAPAAFAPPPPVRSSPSGLGGLVGGPGIAPGGWSGGGLAGVPMPASAGRDGGLGGDGQPVFAREENAAFMPAHLASNLAPTRLANAPTQARPSSPEDVLSTPYRPRAWAEDPAAAADTSWAGNETGEMLLRLPQRETSRNLVVAIVILTIVGLALIGFAVWALLRNDPEDTEDAKPHRATTVEQPRPIAPVIEPKRELVIKDTEPEPKPKPRPAPEPEPESPPPEPEPFDDPEPRPSRRGSGGGGGGGGGGGDVGPVSSLSQAQLDAGFKKARSSINACAKQHGAIEGTSLSVSFDVVEGRAINAKVQPPHGLTPLGRCVVTAVGTNARFAAATEASRAVSRKVSF